MEGDEASGAFAHPALRLARLPPGAAVPDRISLTDLVREVEVGAFEAERGVRQRLAFDMAVEVGAVEAGDDVDRILSYDRLGEAVDAALAEARVSLLETLAATIAAKVLREPQARRVILRIRKLDRGPGALGVEIVRERGEEPGEATAPPPFRLLPVAPDVSGARLAALVDSLDGSAALLVPEGPAAPLPEAEGPAGRRIALLALDQAAWALAARQPRLAVVASRTEIDWAMRRGQVALLAPARLVLDAPEAEGPDLAKEGALAEWVARRLGGSA